MSNKSLITIRLIDAVDNPIKGRKYKVINNKTGQIIAAGPTNNKGCIVEISRDKGTILDVYFESAFGHGLMKVPQNIVMSKDRMIVTLRTKEIKVKLSTKENQGTSGTYKRKTYTIKKGDTLSVIAQKEGTTVRALVYLNNLKNPDKLAIGQVLKLPVNVPATGNNNHQNKPKPKQQKVASQSKTKDKKSSDVGVFEQAKQKLNEYYEEGKKKIDEASKAIENILTIDDRSKETTSPKVNTNNLCKTKPQCISSGKSELIREVNIRLAGFGGALPSDEFTDLTASCIKQFQRDYMGAPETGKICGSVLVALDKFYYEYPISEFMGKAPCPCGKCSGYGNNRRDVKSGRNKANEYPGLHRSLIWILKALNFYLKNEFKDKNLEVAYIESGYRCIDNNKKNGRTSVNHMGLALDIHFNKKGKRTRELTDMEFIRKKVLSAKMRAKEQREENKIYLEPKKFNNGDDGATTWVHFDLTYLSKIYFSDDFFKKNVLDLNGSKIVEFVKDKNNSKILSCSGLIFSDNKEKKNQNIEQNIKAFLDTIAKSEGTYDLGENGYNVMVTGKLFSGYKDHPFTHKDKAIHVKGDLYSTAAGRYQIMRVNWYGTKTDSSLGLKNQLNLNDFSPKNQDIAAISLLKRRGAYNLILQGKINTAFNTTSLNKEWASFPGAGYSQLEHKIDKILNWYKSFGGIVTD